MTVRTQILSPDLQKQIDLLKLYPEIAEKHYRPALEQATAMTESRVRPTIPVLTGRAVAAFGSKVSGKGLNLAGKIGWGSARSDKAAFYINIVEYGARAHEISARKSPRMVFNGQDGSLVAVKSVSHPGLSARSMLKNGLASVQPQVDALMGTANEAVAGELAVP